MAEGIPDVGIRVRIEADVGLVALWRAARQRSGHDPAHDAGHLERVAAWTLRIAGNAVTERDAIAAALLHDYVSVEKNSPDRCKAAEWSAEAVRPLLERHGFGAESVGRIVTAIAAHSFSRGLVPEDPLGRALQDADRLDALGSIGIMRAVVTGARMGSQWTHPEDPWGVGRPFDGRSYTIDHFFEKLLKLPETMLTEPGKAEARRRTDIMIAFLNEFGREIGIPMPRRTESR